MPAALQYVWTLSIALATLSIVSMSVLVGARLVRQRRDKGLLERRKHLSSELIRYSLLGGGVPAIAVRTRHERAIAVQIAVDAFSILDDEARQRLSGALRSVSLDASLRRAASRGRVPDRIAALEALHLFPDADTRATLEQAQASPIFRICLAALRARVELRDFPDLATVLELTERPEGGRSLSLFKIVEACVRADLPAALNLMTPPRESHISHAERRPPPESPSHSVCAHRASPFRGEGAPRPQRARKFLPLKGGGAASTTEPRGDSGGGPLSAREVRESPTLPPKARIMLLKALGAADSWAGFHDIAQASLDPDPEVRAAALTALRAMAAPAALPIFTAALGDPDWQVRLKAVEGVGQLGKRQDRASIEPLLNDPVWWIRFRADEALRRLDGRGPELQLPQNPPKLRKRRPQLAHAS